MMLVAEWAGWKVQQEVNAQNQGYTGFSGLNLGGRPGKAGWNVGWGLSGCWMRALVSKTTSHHAL